MSERTYSGVDTPDGRVDPMVLAEIEYFESMTATKILAMTEIPARRVAEAQQDYHDRVRRTLIHTLIQALTQEYYTAVPAERDVLLSKSVVGLALGTTSDERAILTDPTTWRSALMYLQRVARALASFKAGITRIHEGVTDQRTWVPSNPADWKALSSHNFVEPDSVSDDGEAPALVTGFRDMFPKITGVFDHNSPERISEHYPNLIHAINNFEDSWLYAAIERIWSKRTPTDLNMLYRAGVISDPRAADPAVPPHALGRVKVSLAPERATHSWQQGVYGMHGFDITATRTPFQQLLDPDDASPISAEHKFTTASPDVTPAGATANATASAEKAKEKDAPAPRRGPLDNFFKPAAVAAPAPGQPSFNLPMPVDGIFSGPLPPGMPPPQGMPPMPGSGPQTGRMPPPPAPAAPPAPAPAAAPPHRAAQPQPAAAPALTAADVQDMVRQQLDAQKQTLEREFQQRLDEVQKQGAAQSEQLRQTYEAKTDTLDRELANTQQRLTQVSQNQAPLAKTSQLFAGMKTIDHDPLGHTPPPGKLIHVFKTRTYPIKTPTDVGPWQLSYDELKATFYSNLHRPQYRIPDIPPSGPGEHLVHLAWWLDRVYEVASAFGIEAFCFTNGYPQPCTEAFRASYRTVLNLFAKKIRDALVCPSSSPVVPYLQQITMPTDDSLPFTPDHNVVYRHLVRIKQFVLTECSWADLIRLEERAEERIKQGWKHWEPYVQSFRNIAQIGIEFNKRPDLQWVIETIIRYLWEDDRIDYGIAKTDEVKFRKKIRNDLSTLLETYRLDPINVSLTWDDINTLVSKTLGQPRLMRPGSTMQQSAEAFPGSGTARGYESHAPGSIPTAYHASAGRPQANPAYMLLHDTNNSGAPPVMMPYRGENQRGKRPRSKSRDRSQDRDRNQDRDSSRPRDRYNDHDRRRGRDGKGGPDDRRDSTHDRRADRPRDGERRSRSRSRDDREDRDRNSNRDHYRSRSNSRGRSGDKGAEEGGGCWICGDPGHQKWQCPKKLTAPPLPGPTPPGAHANLAGAMLGGPSMPNFEDGRG